MSLTFQKMTDAAMSKKWAAMFSRFKFREIKDFAETKDGWREIDVILRRCQGLYRPQKISELIRQFVSGVFEITYRKKHFLIINYEKCNSINTEIDGVGIINI